MNPVDVLVEWLRTRADCAVEDGLDNAELRRAETVVPFPPLWRAVLTRAHPVAVSDDVAYPDWRLRDGSAASLTAAPVTGVLFDVEHNGFWWRAWGPRPGDPAEALRLACAGLATVPRLVPIRGHWYTGSRDGDPVFSIVQTDLYVPARTLADLADRAAPRGQDGRSDYPLGAVPFWSDLHVWSQRGK